MIPARASTPLTPAAASFVRRYAAAFEAYVAEPGETVLSVAYELGRQAVLEDVPLLDICVAHHDALAEASARDPAGANAASIAHAAGDFLLEVLASYEMVQRGFRETQTKLELEQRHAGMVRRLSAFLADASLAAGRPNALSETLRLVVEQARELLGVRACRGVVVLDNDGLLNASSVADGDGDDDGDWIIGEDWVDLPSVHDAATNGSRPGEHVVEAELKRLDGRPLGVIIAQGREAAFTEADEAILAHLAQMASAAIERALPYR